MDKNLTKKIIVTGGNGFIGRHLVQRLVQQKLNVIIIDNLSNSKIESDQLKMYGIGVPDFTARQTSFYKADIRDKDVIDDIFKKNPNIDTCIHLAAKISVSDSIRNPSETMSVNINGTHNVLEASANNGVKNFVFASSAAVYGNPENNNLPLKENHRPCPISPYGESKLKGEELVSEYSKYIPNATSLRFFNIYGIGQSYEYAGVITKFADRLTKGQSITIFGDGYQIRDFISVIDVVRSIVIASCNQTNRKKSTIKNRYSNNVFNIATGIPTKIIDIAKILMNIIKKPVSQTNGLSDLNKIVYGKPLLGDIRNSYADIKKSKDLLRFTPQEDIVNGLNNMYKENIIKKCYLSNT